MEFDGFDWDDGNLEKCSKHGVSLDEIEDLFSDQPGCNQTRFTPGLNSGFGRSGGRDRVAGFSWPSRFDGAMVAIWCAP
jgi:hypothetical protein